MCNHVLIAFMFCWSLTSAAAGQTLTAPIRLFPDNGSSAGDRFGASVATSRGKSVVGAFLDDAAGTNAGAAYFFDTAGGTVTKLVAEDAADGDQFGFAVDLDDNIALVGARYHGEPAEGGTRGSGAAYLFDAPTGTQLHRLVPSDSGNPDGEFFGHAAAIGNGIALIGAPQDWSADGRSSDVGSAYLFDATTGEELLKLTAPDGAGGDFFGFSVAIGDGVAVVGTPFDDDNGSQSGSVYVYDTATGVLLDKLVAEDARAGQQFGYSVAIDNGLAVIGAEGVGIASTPGSAYLFDLSTGEQRARWESGRVGEQDRFGESVSIDGSLALIGAGGYNGNVGAAYLFDTQTGDLIKRIDSPLGPGVRDEFGIAVDLDSQSVLTGTQRLIVPGGGAYRYRVVPEPASSLLLGAGCTCVWGRRRKL